MVRSRLFWVRGLSNAWHSRDGVSDELVDAYRLPQLVRGWEVGLVRFIRARVAGLHLTACCSQETDSQAYFLFFCWTCCDLAV